MHTGLRPWAAAGRRRGGSTAPGPRWSCGAAVRYSTPCRARAEALGSRAAETLSGIHVRPPAVRRLPMKRSRKESSRVWCCCISPARCSRGSFTHCCAGCSARHSAIRLAVFPALFRELAANNIPVYEVGGSLRLQLFYKYTVSPCTAVAVRSACPWCRGPSASSRCQTYNIKRTESTRSCFYEAAKT